MRIRNLLPSLLASTAIVSAQVGTGLTGIVSDPSAGRLAGVKLTALNPATGISRSIATNAEGEFRISPLEPGRYDVSAEHPGFQSLKQSGVLLEIGRVTRLDLTLQVGQVTDSVQVTAAGQLLE
jgi:hypothetical protein